MSNSYDYDIELTGNGLRDQETTRIRCPYCGGGSTHERSMAVSRVGGYIKYICHRAACGIAGAISSGARAPTPAEVAAAQAQTARKHEPYTGSLFPLDEEDREYFQQRFYLTPWSKILRNERNQYVMPVIGPGGANRGHVVRLGGWKGTPTAPRCIDPLTANCLPSGGSKVKSYKSWDDAIMQSFYGMTAPGGTFVLVEDQISAMRVAQDTLKTGVALLGTELTIDKVRELQSLKPAKVIFALDADASKKSFTMARDYGMAFPQVRVVLLEKDLKDMTRGDLIWVLDNAD